MKNTSTTRNLRKKLGVTQNELSFFTGTRRAMIARHESGEKHLNLDATVKIDLLNMCILGVFDEQVALHKAEPMVYNVPGVRKHRCRYERSRSIRRLLVAERSLSTFDEERDALRLHLNRLARIDFTQLVGYSASDIEWLDFVMLKMKVKLDGYSDHARMELEVQIATQRAALAVYDVRLAELELAALVETTSDNMATSDLRTEPQPESTDLLEAQLALIESEFCADDHVQRRKTRRVRFVRQISRRSLQPYSRFASPPVESLRRNKLINESGNIIERFSKMLPTARSGVG